MKLLASVIAELQSVTGPRAGVAQQVADFLLDAGSVWRCDEHPLEPPHIRPSASGDGGYDLLCLRCVQKN